MVWGKIAVIIMENKVVSCNGGCLVVLVCKVIIYHIFFVVRPFAYRGQR